MARPYVRGPEADRFWPKVDKTGDCWLWTAAVRPDGYGVFRRSDGTNVRAHVWAFEDAHGPVSAGLELDHLCRNRSCVRPSHLEAVTHAENCRRSLPGGRSWRSAITHCPQGHPYDEANTVVINGSRCCRECRREARRRSERKRRKARRM